VVGILKMVESVVDVSDYKCDIIGVSDKVTMPVPASELQVSSRYFIS
jgi:hypothetical protein